MSCDLATWAFAFRRICASASTHISLLLHQLFNSLHWCKSSSSVRTLSVCAVRLPRVANTQLRHVLCCICLNWNCAQFLKISQSVQSRREQMQPQSCCVFLMPGFFRSDSLCWSRRIEHCHIMHACMAQDRRKGARTFSRDVSGLCIHQLVLNFDWSKPFHGCRNHFKSCRSNGKE